ncbi:MAG: methylated-DNA--[protein]-cysteine S-methyltransferase [Polyangia bacterium]|jgi:methylated-DNA-[protein]-cysteine S-methyltransferase
MNLYTKIRTDLGTLALGFSEKGISRVVYPAADFAELDQANLRRLGLHQEAAPPRAVGEVARALQAHLAGKVQSFTGAPLDVEGVSPFLLRVQRAAQAIPAGHTCSYRDLAVAAGSPNAARGAGRAMSTNPWPIIVPCHRVLPRTGFGQYSAGSGVETKLRLLWREGYRGRTSNVTFDEHAAQAHLMRHDARLAALIERVGPFTMQAVAPHARSGVEPFTALAKAIVSQQLSGKAARTIYTRVAALTGGDAIVSPPAVLALAPAQLRSAGLSQAKMLALRDLAEHARAGTLPSRAEMESLTDEAIVARLSAIRGIGRWSAEMLLLFYLGRPNVLPVADLGVRKGFALTYRLPTLPSTQLVAQRARPWLPYASVASWYMWRAVEVHRYAAAPGALERRSG